MWRWFGWAGVVMINANPCRKHWIIELFIVYLV